MIENKMTVGQMIDHLGLNASYRPPHGLALSSDGVLVWSDCASGIYASWPGEFRYLFDSFEEALRWLCEKKDNDFQIYQWKVDEYRQLWVGIAIHDQANTFVKSNDATSWEVWKARKQGAPRPTDEQLDDLVRNHPILGLICEQMWGIPPKEEA